MEILSFPVCGFPVLLWLVILVLLAVFVGSLQIDPPISRRPPAHPPGWGNIKKNKKRGSK